MQWIYAYTCPNHSQKYSASAQQCKGQRPENGTRVSSHLDKPAPEHRETRVAASPRRAPRNSSRAAGRSCEVFASARHAGGRQSRVAPRRAARDISAAKRDGPSVELATRHARCAGSGGFRICFWPRGVRYKGRGRARRDGRACPTIPCCLLRPAPRGTSSSCCTLRSWTIRR